VDIIGNGPRISDGLGTIADAASETIRRIMDTELLMARIVP
jgi:hypothetical protein